LELQVMLLSRRAVLLVASALSATAVAFTAQVAHVETTAAARVTAASDAPVTASAADPNVFEWS